MMSFVQVILLRTEYFSPDKLLYLEISPVPVGKKIWLTKQVTTFILYYSGTRSRYRLCRTFIELGPGNQCQKTSSFPKET